MHTQHHTDFDTIDEHGRTRQVMTRDRAEDIETVPNEIYGITMSTPT